MTYFFGTQHFFICITYIVFVLHVGLYFLDLQVKKRMALRYYKLIMERGVSVLLLLCVGTIVFKLH